MLNCVLQRIFFTPVHLRIHSSFKVEADTAFPLPEILADLGLRMCAGVVVGISPVAAPSSAAAAATIVVAVVIATTSGEGGASADRRQADERVVVALGQHLLDLHIWSFHLLSNKWHLVWLLIGAGVSSVPVTTPSRVVPVVLIGQRLTLPKRKKCSVQD